MSMLVDGELHEPAVAAHEGGVIATRDAAVSVGWIGVNNAEHMCTVHILFTHILS